MHKKYEGFNGTPYSVYQVMHKKDKCVGIFDYKRSAIRYMNSQNIGIRLYVKNNYGDVIFRRDVKGDIYEV